MQLTKGKFLEILNAIDPDPQLLARIVTDCMKRLPDAYSWQLAQQLYMQYYWKGPVITLTNNITGVVRKFASNQDIITYLQELGYTCSPSGVSGAIRSRSRNYCNHTFDRENEKEITYFE